MHFFFLPAKGEGTKGEIKGGTSSGIVSTNSLWADVMVPRLSPVSRLAVKACWVCLSPIFLLLCLLVPLPLLLLLLSQDTFCLALLSHPISHSVPARRICKRLLLRYEFNFHSREAASSAASRSQPHRTAASSQGSGNGREYISYWMRG